MSDEMRVESTWVLYSCKRCGAIKERVGVRSRGAAENVVSWVNSIAQTVANHHQINHPGCTGTHCDLMIPLGLSAGESGGAA